MPSAEDSAYVRLEGLLQSREGERIRELDRYLQRRQPTSTVTILTITSSRLIDIGPALTITDRELRRAVRILETEPYSDENSYNFGIGPGSRPRPISTRRGGLRVYGATAGSIHLFVEAYGEVQNLLLSKPITAVVTICTLSQATASIRA